MIEANIKEIEEKIFNTFGVTKEILGYMEENKTVAEIQYKEFLRHMGAKQYGKNNI